MPFQSESSSGKVRRLRSRSLYSRFFMRCFKPSISVFFCSRSFTSFLSSILISWSTWKVVWPVICESGHTVVVSAGGAAAGAAAAADGGGGCGALSADRVVAGVVACCWLGISGLGVLLFCAVV